jgi:glycosyltransferase involved in cell wall biosynthesis
MRIAFLSPFYPYRGGIAQFSDSLFLELSKNNDVKAFTFKRMYPSILFPGTSQYVLKDDIDRGIRADRLLDSINPFTFRKTARKILAFNPDLLLLSFWMPFFAPSLGGVAKRVRKKNKNVKIISILHNVIPHEERTGDIQLTRRFFDRNDGFVVLNESSKRDLLVIKRHSKYIVHPHPLYDHYGEKIDKKEARARLGIESGRKVLLFFGLIRDYKGLDLLIDAMTELDDSYLLLIAGEVYGKFDKYKDMIQEKRLQNRISLHLKYIPDSELPLYFSAADICVLPYRSGTQSGIVAVSYHFGLPVIVTDTGGLKEMVTEGKTGHVVPEPNPMLIADAAAKFLENEDRAKYTENIEKFKQERSWENFVRSLLDFYKNM